LRAPQAPFFLKGLFSIEKTPFSFLEKNLHSGMSSDFVTCGLDDWPLVVLSYKKTNPTVEEANKYFAFLTDLLNVRATPQNPCILIFDVLSVKMSLSINPEFCSTHDQFNRAYKERMKLVCSAYGILVSNKILSSVVKAAISFTPPSQPCIHFKSLEEAIQHFKGKA
jgi:hypothetical protein